MNNCNKVWENNLHKKFLTTDMFRAEKLLDDAIHLLHISSVSGVGFVAVFNPVKPLAQAALLDSHNTPKITVIRKS